MIPEKTNIEIIRSEGFKETKAKIVANAAMLKILRSGIYSDKILATMRETVMNAIDSHIQAGKPDEPIEVTLPSILDPVFKVKDKGVGLDDYGVREILFSYGDPVGDNIKNTSNEFYGCYHIGAKSPWSYVDSFEVIAIKDGVRRIYNAYIDEQDENSIAQIGEENTDEPNGVEIIVSVKQEDINTFVEKAKNLFKFLKIKPIVSGNSNYTHAKFSSLLEGEGWAIPNESQYNKYYIVIGGVGYNLNPSIFTDKYAYGSIEKKVLQRGLVLFCNIGEVDIAVSREEISYTKKTKDFVEKKMAEVKENIRQSILSKFDACNSVFEVKKLFYDLKTQSENIFIYSLIETAGQDKFYYDFKGEKIYDHIFRFRGLDWFASAFESSKKLNSSKGKKYNKSEIDNISFFDVENYGHKCYYFLSNNNKGSRKEDYEKNARRYLVNKSTLYSSLGGDYESLFCFDITDIDKFQKWKVDNGIPEDMFEDFYPTLYVPKVKYVKGVSSGVERIRGSYRARRMSDKDFATCCTTVDFNKVGEAYYIYSFRNSIALEAKGQDTLDYSENIHEIFESASNIYKSLGHDKPIYALSFDSIEKLKNNKKLKDKILPLSMIVRPYLEKFYSDNKQQFYYKHIADHFSYHHEQLKNLFEIYNILKKDKYSNKFFSKLDFLFGNMTLSKISHSGLATRLGIKKPVETTVAEYFTNYSLTNILNEIFNKYPLMKFISQTYGSFSGDIYKEFQRYIKLIDSEKDEKTVEIP